MQDKLISIISRNHPELGDPKLWQNFDCNFDLDTQNFFGSFIAAENKVSFEFQGNNRVTVTTQSNMPIKARGIRSLLQSGDKGFKPPIKEMTTINGEPLSESNNYGINPETKTIEGVFIDTKGKRYKYHIDEQEKTFSYYDQV